MKRMKMTKDELAQRLTDLERETKDEALIQKRVKRREREWNEKLEILTHKVRKLQEVGKLPEKFSDKFRTENPAVVVVTPYGNFDDIDRMIGKRVCKEYPVHVETNSSSTRKDWHIIYYAPWKDVDGNDMEN